MSNFKRKSFTPDFSTNVNRDWSGLTRFKKDVDFSDLTPNVLSASASFRNFHINFWNQQQYDFWLMDAGVKTEIMRKSNGANVIVRVSGWIRYSPYSDVKQGPSDPPDMTGSGCVINIMVICE